MLVITSKAYSGSDDSWKMTVAPYLWALNMNGHVQVATAKVPVSESFEDILSQFQGGGMLWVDAHKEKVGLFANAMYAVLSQNIASTPVSISSHNDFGIFSAGVSYEVFSKTFSNQVSQFRLEPYLGARYTLNNTTLKVAGLSFTDNQHWTDPIIGARATYDINKAWQAILAGDVGGTNFNDDKSYNVQGFIGYKPCCLKNSTLYAGYRLLSQDYTHGSGINRFTWDMKLFGPVIGAAFEF